MRTRYWGYSRERGWTVCDRTVNAIECPDCGGRAYRTPRRFLDRLISLLSPVQRYRCESRECRWDGIVTVNRRTQQPA